MTLEKALVWQSVLASILPRPSVLYQIRSRRRTGLIGGAARRQRNLSSSHASGERGLAPLDPMARFFSSLLAPRRCRKHRNFDTRRKARRAINSLRRLPVVGLLRFKDIRHEHLRVAIDNRKPAALHLHHDMVPFLENVIRRV